MSAKRNPTGTDVAEFEEMGHFARRLKSLRLNRRLTQEGAAKLAGVSVVAWRKWECGLKAPNYIYLRRIVVNLGASADVLMGLEGGGH